MPPTPPQNLDPTQTPARLSRLHFLVVDDFATMRRIVRNLLREMGHPEVDEAVDGRAALEMLRARPYDFVVADVQMPHLNGFDLVRAMRQDAALQSVPVLLVTPSASKEHVVLAARVQANGYIVRPLTRSSLEDKVCGILGLPPVSGRVRPTFSTLALRPAR
jgi:two-component system chemotaxis response regulator CheY